MNKNIKFFVHFHLNILHKLMGDVERNISDYDGYVYLKKNSIYLVYEDSTNNISKVFFVISDNKIKLIRKDEDHRLYLEFLDNIRNGIGNYETIYGNLNLEVECIKKKFKLDYNLHRGKLYLKYRLFTYEHILLGDYLVRLNFNN